MNFLLHWVSRFSNMANCRGPFPSPSSTFADSAVFHVPILLQPQRDRLGSGVSTHTALTSVLRVSAQRHTPAAAIGRPESRTLIANANLLTHNESENVV
jgi:hypothetical protein